MKFSVLLPTRNRLDLLARAIETVCRQDYENWEIIVSDNYSKENISGYIKSLNDSRIKYFRTESFIPVTDNWNSALEKSDGDYVIMLGDDDGLMRSYFSTLNDLIQRFDRPDFVYTSAFLYAYPDVMPDLPEGFLRTYSQRKIYHGKNKPFLLEQQEAIKFARASLNFQVQFDYNMQFSLVSRSLIEQMKEFGSFYQSPYPDYYASNAIMLQAKKILIAPHPLIAIGISPKSFGFYYFNDAESEGTAFLKNIPDQSIAKRLENIILPGTDMNTSWLISMETLADKFDLPVAYSRYRELQIRSVYAALFQDKERAWEVLCELKCHMTVYEKLRYHLPFWLMFKLLPTRYFLNIAHRIIQASNSHPATHMPKVGGDFNTLLDVFNNIDPTHYEEN